jgi:predicted nucleic acid-binding protein
MTRASVMSELVHLRASSSPLGPAEAFSHVDSWLERAWVPVPTDRHADVLRRLVVDSELRGNLISDAHLAALAVEYGVGVCSADSDFARFDGVTWINPLRLSP